MALSRMCSFNSRCLRSNSSKGICPNHWKGVKGFGTKQDTLTVTFTPRLPLMDV